MIGASRSIVRTARTPAGKKLPRIPWLATLHDGKFKVRFRRGTVIMVTGQSGSMKSMFMLNIAHEMNEPTLYFSADMEESTATSRLAGMITGTSTEWVSYNVNHGEEEKYAEALSDSRIQFSYDPNPTIDTVWAELAAYVELFDEYPAIIIIDNLMDVVADGDSEWGGLKQLIMELKTLARETQAAVFIMHHMTESGEGRDRSDANRPAARRKLLGKLSHTAGLILSVAYDRTQGLFGIAVVKNRYGEDDPEATEYYSYRADPSTARFFPRERESA